MTRNGGALTKIDMPVQGPMAKPKARTMLASINHLHE